MRTRHFTSAAGLGTAAVSLLLGTSLAGCGGAAPEESDAVETRSDAFEDCQTNSTYWVSPNGEEGAECEVTICTRANGCWWSRTICSDGTDEYNESNCWSQPEIGCSDDWDCPYASRCNDFTQVCEYY